MITQALIGVTFNLGSYQSLKIELTSSISDGQDYNTEVDNLLSELQALKEKSLKTLGLHESENVNVKPDKAAPPKSPFGQTAKAAPLKNPFGQTAKAAPVELPKKAEPVKVAPSKNPFGQTAKAAPKDNAPADNTSEVPTQPSPKPTTKKPFSPPF